MGLRNLTPKVEQPTTSTMSTALTKTPQQEEQEKLNRQKQLGEQAAAGVGAKGPAMLGGKSSAEPQQKTSSQPQKAGTGSFTNLKSYLQAAQGGGQRRLAEAASGQVERLGTGAKKSVETARDVFGRNLQTGSGAVFQGIEGQTLAEQEEAATRRAQEQTQGAISTATNTTYQAPPEGESIQYFTPEQEQQFSNVINASYAGPASLQQIGEYGEAARRSAAAQQAAQQTQSAAGRAQLLRDVYGRNRDYGRGASRLDAMLLNASEQGVQQLQQQAQPALQAREALQAAENISANEAAQRAGSIEKLRTGAMTDFINARQEQEDEANAYIKNIQDNWNQLPNYMKESFSQSMADGGYNLSPEEMAILGLNQGQSLFGITPEAIKATAVASGAELITKDQLSRQLALARLAGLDMSQSLKKDLLYTDLEKAETKDILSSLDMLGFQNELAQREQAALNKLSGINNRIGTSGYYGEQTAFGPKTTAWLQGDVYNLKDLLLNQGGYTALNPQERAELAASNLKDLYLNPELYTNPDIKNTQALSDVIRSNLDINTNPQYEDFWSLSRGRRNSVAAQARDIRNTQPGVRAALDRLFSENWRSSVADPLAQAGFTRDVRASTSAAAKQRAEGLMNLLKNFGKK